MPNYIAPNLEAEPTPFGILSPASVVLETADGAWETRLEYTDYTCNSETTVEGICIPGLTEQITAVANAGDGGFLHEYRPFSIETSFECSPMSMSLNEIEDLAKKALEACRQKAIEAEFSAGMLSQKIKKADDKIVNPYLADGTALELNPGQSVSPKVGLALLEQSLADCGCGTRGTIHGKPLATSVFGRHIKEEDGHLETRLGNYVISGAGYTGQSPTGAVVKGTESYMYATGRVLVVLGKVNVYPSDHNKRYEAVNISNNTVRYTVSQTAAVVSGGCCKSAVLVDIAK